MKHIVQPLEAELKGVESSLKHYSARQQEVEQEAVALSATVAGLSARKDALRNVIATVKTL